MRLDRQQWPRDSGGTLRQESGRSRHGRADTRDLTDRLDAIDERLSSIASCLPHEPAQAQSRTASAGSTSGSRSERSLTRRS